MVAQRFFGLLLLAVLVASQTASAQLPAPQFGLAPDLLYRPYLQGDGLIRSEESLGYVSLFDPIWQSDSQLLFADFRFLANSDIYEGNLGVGYRHIDRGWVVGRHIFWDRRKTANDNYFSQITVGLELMNKDWDFRANGYIPLTDGQGVAPAFANYTNGTIRVSQLQEVQYHGADAEIGYLLADSDDGNTELRVFGGGFWFDHDGEFQEIAGGRVRAELRLYDLPFLGAGTRLMIGGEYRYDDVREDVSSALVSLRIPLRSKFQIRSTDRLERRMMNPIVRDIDIVTNIGNVNEAAIDVETGQQFGPVTLVSGATADPNSAIFDAGANSTVVVTGDSGTIDLTAPIQLASGQTVRGAGFTVRARNSGQTDVFGSAPTINGTDSSQNVFIAASNSTFQDLTITGGQNSIYGDSATGITIDNVTMNGPALSGVRFDNTASGTIIDSSVSGAGSDGIGIATWGSGTLSNNTITNSGNHGLAIAELNSGTIADNLFTNNVANGLNVATMTTGTISGNTLTNNGGHGYQSLVFTGGTINGNTANGNTLNGFDIAFSDFTVGDMPEFINNVANSNTVGFRFGELDGGDINDNSATSNTSHGFEFGDVSIVDVERNTSTSNGGHGFLILDNSLGNFAQNTATSNAQDGFHIVDMTLGDIDNNTAQSNDGDGFEFENWTFGGSLNGNAANNNNGAGYIVGTGTSRDISNNSASGNGDDTLP